MPRLAKRLVRSSGLALLGLTILAPAAQAGGIGPEPPRSGSADEIGAAYWVTLVVVAVLVVAVNAALIAAVVRFRASRDRPVRRTRGGRGVQPRVAAGLAVLAAGVFVYGIVFAERARDIEASPAEAAAPAQEGEVDGTLAAGQPLDIAVSGQRWLWRYEYPDGTFSYYELVVPVDTPVNLTIDSTDVLHRWWVPSLSGKADANPGQSNEISFVADREGTYEGGSAAFSGPGYPTMRTAVRVVGATEFEAWLERQGRAIQDAQEAVQQLVRGGSAPGVEGR